MMTHIKEILLIALGFGAFSANVKAQSTPMNPYEGATHTYVVNGLTPGTEYMFYVSSNEDGSAVLDDGSAFEFDFLSTSQGIVPADQNTVSLPIIWNNGASQHMYYLWISLSNPGGCSVKRGLKIVPQPNMFDLLSENIPFDKTESCPAISDADGFVAMSDHYNAGTTTLQFKVRREGGNRGWSFEPFVTINPEWNLDVAIVSVTAANAGVLTANASNTFTVPATENEVIVSVAVRNYEGTEQIVTLEVRNQREEQTSLGDVNRENDKVTHRITVMPIISDLEEL